MPVIRRWNEVERQAAIVHEAVDMLSSGQVVAFPTEAGYVLAAAAFQPTAVAKLGAYRPSSLTLALRGAAEAPDWVPDLSPLGRRLANRSWPGPLTLQFADGYANGLGSRLPRDTWEYLNRANHLQLRAPAHESIHHALRRHDRPVVFANAVGLDGALAYHSAQVLAHPAETADLIIDAEATRYQSPSSVIRIEGGQWQMVEEGVVTSAVAQRLTARIILFLCTGNTCRSPLAEGFAKKLLAERLGCAIAELPEKGFLVLSAGLSATNGMPASAEAVELAQTLGVVMDRHVSQALTAHMLAQADHVFTMTRGHMRALAARFPRAMRHVEMLSSHDEDIADPIGGDTAVYAECIESIRESLIARLGEWMDHAESPPDASQGPMHQATD